MSIDFSKAPEGATHYSSTGCWYREVDGVVECAHSDGVSWFRSRDHENLDWLAPITLFEPFVSVEDAPTTGSKHDSGKPLMGAVPPNAMLAVAKVLTFGARSTGGTTGVRLRTPRPVTWTRRCAISTPTSAASWPTRRAAKATWPMPCVV